MKVRVLLAVVAMMSLTATGCSGFRNCLFGRGAACGSCASAGPTMNIAPPPPAPCGNSCGGYAGEANCGCGSSSYSPAMGGDYYGGYENGGVIGNGVTYPEGYIPGMPSDGGSWVPRGEYIVPGSTYPMESGTTMGPVTAS